MLKRVLGGNHDIIKRRLHTSSSADTLKREKFLLCYTASNLATVDAQGVFIHPTADFCQKELVCLSVRCASN